MSGSMRCPTCGTMYGAEARFCTRDGSKLNAFAPGGPAAIPAASPAAPAAAPAGASATAVRSTSFRANEAAKSGAASSHASMAGKVLDRRYHIVRKVGEGGMSYVYLAHDVATQERYAIKILSPALSKDENAMARLRREAALGIRLAHPNVCHIMRMGETEDGLVYVVMPYVEGEILRDRKSVV